jgi:hypothetical protein
MMKLLMLYETDKECLEVKEKDVVWLFRWPRRVFIKGISSSPCPMMHADLKGSDTHCSKCRCAICARLGYQRERNVGRLGRGHK